MASQGTLSLFKKADMEGYLEKVSSGITSKLKSSRTRVWCELYETTLHIFKESKRTSTGAQEIDMNQVHMVRKPTTDKTGNQFEILCKNKPQTFAAPSVDECNNWIKALQHSMTLKGLDDKRRESVRKMSLGDYETIMVSSENTAIAAAQLTVRASNASESGYAEVEFQNAPASPIKTPTMDTDKGIGSTTQPEGNESTATEKEETQTVEGGYSVVEVVRRKSSVSQPVLQEVKDTSGSAATSESPSSSDQTATPPKEDTDEYGYATVEVKASDAAKDSQPQSQLPQTSRTEAEGSEEDSYGYAKVNRQPTSPAAQPSEESSRSAGDGASDDASDEDEDEEFARLMSQSSPKPIPKFPHPLHSTDSQPLVELEEFLSNNRKVCRRSFLEKNRSEDPVGDLKKFLLELQS